jgi:hypothetical protein
MHGRNLHRNGQRHWQREWQWQWQWHSENLFGPCRQLRKAAQRFSHVRIGPRQLYANRGFPRLKRSGFLWHSAAVVIAPRRRVAERLDRLLMG